MPTGYDYAEEFRAASHVARD